MKIKRIFIKKYIKGNYETLHIFYKISSLKISGDTLLIRHGSIFSYEKTISINIKNLNNIELIYNDMNVYIN